MNTGIISSRYARALCKFVALTGNGRKVYEQALALEKCIMQVEALKAVVNNPKAVPDKVMMRLFTTAVGGRLESEMSRFLNLVMENRRTHFLPVILRIFIMEYRRENNIHVGKLTLAVSSEEFEKKLVEDVRRKMGGEVSVETEIDPSIIGGFIYEMENRRLDASVVSRIMSLKRQYIEKNRRIV